MTDLEKKNKLVKENLENFERGLGPKASLGIGVFKDISFPLKTEWIGYNIKVSDSKDKKIFAVDTGQYYTDLKPHDLVNIIEEMVNNMNEKFS